MPEDSASAPFDAEAMLKEIQRGAREAEEVARLRPTGRELAELLRSRAELLYELLDATRRMACLEAARDPSQTYTWIARPGSVAASDRSAFEVSVTRFAVEHTPKTHHWLDTNPTRNPSDWAIEFLTRCLYTVIDGLSALATLIEDGKHLRSPIILARSMLEAAALGCFIADVEVSSTERLRRTLNLHLAQLTEAANEVRNLAGDFSYEEQRVELADYARCAGFEVREGRKAWQPPVIPGGRAGGADSARVMVDAVLPGGVGQSMWRSLSAVAHSRESQLLLPDQYTPPHEIRGHRRVQSVAWHSLPALLVTQLLVQRLRPFLGWDCDAWAEALGPTFNAWYVGAGMADDRIRAQLGFG